MSHLIREGIVLSAHDISDGGLAVAVSEMCMKNLVGVSIHVESDNLTNSLTEAGFLFSEGQGRILLEVVSMNAQAVLAQAKAANVPARFLGKTGGNELIVRNLEQKLVQIDVGTLVTLYEEAIPNYMNTPVSAKRTSITERE